MSSGSKLFLGKADHGAKISHEEFAEAEFEEPWRYERVKGRLVVMPPAGYEHQRPTTDLTVLVGGYGRSRRDLVEDVIADAWFMIDDDTERIADLAVFLLSPKKKGKLPQRAPDIAFEIVSEGSDDRKRDYEEKHDEYERAGVQEYVIIDRFDHCVTVFRRKRGKYVKSVLEPDDVYTTPLLPGLEIPLHEIIG